MLADAPIYQVPHKTLLRVLAGIVVAIVRDIGRITYAPKLTLTLCFGATWYANKVNVRGAHCKQREMLPGKSLAKS